MSIAIADRSIAERARHAAARLGAAAIRGTALAALPALLLLAGGPASADEAVKIGGAYALLNKPQGPAKAGIVLIPGGDGDLGVKPDGTFEGLRGNQLVRTRKRYLRHGIATLTVDKDVNVAAAVTHMRTVASPVFVVATSRGSLKVAGALSAKPDGVVLTAAFLSDVRGAIGAAGKLPPTLVVHHRKDGCKHTPPGGVAPFQTWGGAKVSVVWLEGGQNEGDPCRAKGFHGFAGLDDKVVETVAGFATGPR